eukprot:2345610-Amphidinium_carterae.1
MALHSEYVKTTVARLGKQPCQQLAPARHTWHQTCYAPKESRVKGHNFRAGRTMMSIRQIPSEQLILFPCICNSQSLQFQASSQFGRFPSKSP